MPLPRTRAFRRALRLVVQQRRRHHWGRGVGRYGPPPDAAFFGKVVDTPTPCSCWQCRSPRYSMKGRERWTVQELRALARARDLARDAERDGADG